MVSIDLPFLSYKKLMLWKSSVDILINHIQYDICVISGQQSLQRKTRKKTVNGNDSSGDNIKK
jgi:hypothetical protein